MQEEFFICKKNGKEVYEKQNVYEHTSLLISEKRPLIIGRVEQIESGNRFY